MRVILMLLLAVVVSGCGKAAPPLVVGGKPVSHWVGALKAPDASLRKKAAFKLGNVGGTAPAVLPALIDGRKAPDPAVRREVILALMKCGPAAKEAIPALTVVQQSDRDARVREHAARALDRLRAG